MKNFLLPFIFMLVTAPFLSAQNCDCPIPAEEPIDYCYMSSTESLEGKCLFFIRNAEYFLYHDATEKKKKRRKRKIPVYSGETFDQKYLLSLAQEKKLKLETEDILFLKLGLMTWDPAGYVITRSGLRYQINEEGDGALPQVGSQVKVHYKGYLEDGTVFDDSYSRGKPFAFELGKGKVIKGWDEGVALFTVGTKATLKIPPELGYGNKKMGKIPANSTLFFDIEVMGTE